MLMLRITQCPDPLMWYADKVGKNVPYCGQWPEAYKSREDAGYINMVKFEDAEVIDVESGSRVAGIRAPGKREVFFVNSRAQ